MKKLVIKGVIILAASGLVMVLLFRDRIPFGRSNSSFSVSPGNTITMIEFSEKGKKLTLEKTGENWFLNGKSETRKSGVLFMLRILQEIQIKSPVSEEIFESEISAKNIQPVRVRVYDKRKLVSSFLVYKTQSNKYGNIMKVRERSKPFIVCVPGFDGDIGSGFTLNELFWEPYIVFNLLPSEITSVKFENFADTASSFLITVRDHIPELSASGGHLAGWDSSLVARYLSYFAWIPFEKWALDTGEDEKEAIEAKTPLYRITVITSDGKTTALTLWEKMTIKNNSEEKDSDRLFGRTGENDELFIMRYFDIDPLLKKRSYFFPQ